MSLVEVDLKSSMEPTERQLWSKWNVDAKVRLNSCFSCLICYQDFTFTRRPLNGLYPCILLYLIPQLNPFRRSSLSEIATYCASLVHCLFLPWFWLSLYPRWTILETWRHFSVIPLKLFASLSRGHTCRTRDPLQYVVNESCYIQENLAIFSRARNSDTRVRQVIESGFRFF